MGLGYEHRQPHGRMGLAILPDFLFRYHIPFLLIMIFMAGTTS